MTLLLQRVTASDTTVAGKSGFSVYLVYGFSAAVCGQVWLRDVRGSWVIAVPNRSPV